MRLSAFILPLRCASATLNFFAVKKSGVQVMEMKLEHVQELMTGCARPQRKKGQRQQEVTPDKVYIEPRCSIHPFAGQAVAPSPSRLSSRTEEARAKGNNIESSPVSRTRILRSVFVLQKQFSSLLSQVRYLRVPTL